MNIAALARAQLSPMVAASARHRLMVLALALLLAAASIYATSHWLGVTTDTGGMFAKSLPWKQRSDALARLFPQNDNLIVAVIDSPVPEEAEETAAALAKAIAADKTHFESVRQPSASPYLARNAFLLIDQKTLQSVLDRTTDAQPFLGELVADPSLRGLASALGLVVQGIQHGTSLAGITPALESFRASLDAAAAGHAKPLSWQLLLGGKLAEQAGRYRFVLAKPRLDYDALQPGGVAAKALRAAAMALPDVKSGNVRVRLTGEVVLDDEEFASVAEGAVAGLIGSLLLVMLWLYLAVRSWRLMLPIMATLVLGLLYTTGFAAVAIGTLNLISVAFAILFVGIAVDFAIQFTVRFRERSRTHPGMVDSMRETGRRSGAQILVAALGTAAGFLAFTPTKFIGVAQLGVIAGVGMIIAFACTLTILPALLCLCRPRSEPREVGFTRLRPLDGFVVRRRWPIVVLFFTLAATGGILAGQIRFDGDPLHTKDPHSEAMRTLYDLMQDPITNPYTIEALLPSLPAAQRAADKLATLPLTDEVLTLNSLLPEDQPEKLAAIADAASVLDVSLAPPARVPAVTPGALRQAASKLAGQIAGLGGKLPTDDPLRAIGADMGALAAGSDSKLMAANTALTRFLPVELQALRDALAAKPVTLADIPPDLTRDWILPDGRARVQALPKSAVVNGHALRSWVKGALKAVPAAAGSAVWILKSADTITNAFQIAAYSAIGAIAVILSIALRRATDVALVMTPLLISGLLTALLLKTSGMSLNFANIIALPLLLGVGVSFNIYFVMNWRSGASRFISSATARAVMFSALTTGTAFGSLALSRHPGTASMGDLLLMSLGCTVVTSLVFVPAMLAIVPRQRVPLRARLRSTAAPATASHRSERSADPVR
ncbi:MAG TPA: MMPL family transporter [Acetobacteraceae bacterium]|nr:MMPL family transporter [Acetobacteraceae bacterium]